MKSQKKAAKMKLHSIFIGPWGYRIFAQMFMLGWLCLLLSGCVIAIGGGSKEVVYTCYPPGAVKSPAAQEIDASAKLSFETSRVEVLERIATQPGLMPTDQLYLIQAIFQQLSFDSNREKLLVSLIHNPSFNLESRQAVLARISELSFESTRTYILQELHNRGLASPAPVLVTPSAPTPVISTTPTTTTGPAL